MTINIVCSVASPRFLLSHRLSMKSRMPSKLSRSRDNVNVQRRVYTDPAFFIPALGKDHPWEISTMALLIWYY